MSSSGEKVDRLSSLPEEILLPILSLIPTKFAVRTSILSKRWRYHWMSVTNLDFDDIHPIHGLECLTKFVDRVLKLCKTSEVKLFRLRFCEIWARKPSVSKWISEAVRLNVHELDVQVLLLEVPLNLFTCKTLTSLRLVYCSDDRNWDAWNLSSVVDLPSLKTLDISVFKEPSLNAFKLINGCPLLESLTLSITWRENKEDYNFNIPTLKRLKLTMHKCASIINNVVLNAPNLECLYVGGRLCSLFVIKDLSSLVKAEVSFEEVRYNHLLVELLRGISGAKSLSWSYPTVGSLELPKFSYLKYLELKSCFNAVKWPLIHQFLENASELEHLSIHQNPEDGCWVEPQIVPTCMRMNLRTIKFEQYKGWKKNLRFLQYMLENSKVLKTLTVKSEGMKIEEELLLCTKLLKFPITSRQCEFHFVGNYLSTLRE